MPLFYLVIENTGRQAGRPAYFTHKASDSTAGPEPGDCQSVQCSSQYPLLSLPPLMDLGRTHQDKMAVLTQNTSAARCSSQCLSACWGGLSVITVITFPDSQLLTNQLHYWGVPLTYRLPRSKAVNHISTSRLWTIMFLAHDSCNII